MPVIILCSTSHSPLSLPCAHFSGLAVEHARAGCREGRPAERMAQILSPVDRHRRPGKIGAIGRAKIECCRNDIGDRSDLSGGHGVAGGDPALRCQCKSRSEEQTSEIKSLMRTTYAVLCLQKK